MTNLDVLALKYRPKNFDELVGQESVSKTLKFSLQNNKIGTGYLFSGLRGSGKTSSARIFAKTILCENRIDSIPCEECENCKMANSGSHIDIIEMDGASNRKIDDIRDLIDQTQYNPSVGKFKIFIIDEVHMLTKEAFNALLKTLEEPPSYIKFILATTDPLKLPPTILSRTQHFAFKKIDFNLVVEHLKKIMKLERVEFENEAIETISRSGGGSLRDTLTLLQQAIVFSGDKLKNSNVIEMLGLVDPSILENIFSLVKDKNREKLLLKIRELGEYETETVLEQFIKFLKEKLFENEIPIAEIEKIFTALNDGKVLLSTGADNEFVLYLTFLKMISDVQTERIVEKVVEKETPKIEKEETPQTKNSDLEDFFWNEVLETIIMGNPNEKISDEVFRKCIEEHISFGGLENDKIILKFFFDCECECRNILKDRYFYIETAVVISFTKKVGEKLKFLPKTEINNNPKKIEIKTEPETKKEIRKDVSYNEFVENLKILGDFEPKEIFAKK
ncbi:DNA polymerase III, subunit gamma/tau [Thiovulum sp. ES]|nr:DNA polymerase III, subunit gamma/tau [Thiovulum sp. ES]